MVNFECVDSRAKPPESAQRLLEHWQQFNAGGDRPTRSDFTPFTLKPWLGNIDIYDTEGGGEDFRLRLNGSQVVALTGENWKGKTARDVDRRFGTTLHDAFQQVYRSKRPRGDYIRLFQKEFISAYRLLLPIFSNEGDGTISQIFLALFTTDD
jgi:hypothetical protein